jgi:hypothetical protein
MYSVNVLAQKLNIHFPTCKFKGMGEDRKHIYPVFTVQALNLPMKIYEGGGERFNSKLRPKGKLCPFFFCCPSALIF